MYYVFLCLKWRTEKRLIVILLVCMMIGMVGIA